jgi:hypothetical protein
MIIDDSGTDLGSTPGRSHILVLKDFFILKLTSQKKEQKSSTFT